MEATEAILQSMTQSQYDEFMAVQLSEASRIRDGRAKPSSAIDLALAARRRRSGGFSGLAEFMQSVARAPQDIDRRLLNAASSPAAVGAESVGADGGYAAPPDVRDTVLRLVKDEESLFSRTLQVDTTSNTLLLPADATAPWDTTRGVQVAWESENVSLAQSRPSASAVEVRAPKIVAFVPCSEEMFEDARGLDAYLRAVCPAKLDFALTNAIVNGDGDGKPLGIMRSGAKIMQPKESSQAGTIIAANVQKMLSRLHAACRRTAVWLVHPEAEPQLEALGLPYYVPAGLSGSSFATLLGLPLMPTEVCQPLGTEGDLILFDPQSYLTAVRGLRQAWSLFVWWDVGVGAFRFTMRVGGQPLWAAPIARPNTSTTISSIVTVGTRA